MTTSVDVDEARAALSQLLRRVATGEEITITHRGQAVARLVPPLPRAGRRLGFDRKRFVMPEDFDAPLPDDVLDNFER